MVIFLYYQIPASKLVAVILTITFVCLLAAVGILALVQLYNSQRRAFIAEKRVIEQEVAERTRQHIAFELHSHIGQSLATAVALSGDIPTSADNEKQQDDIHALQSHLTTCLEDLRMVAQVIQGDRLLASGLLHALRANIELIQRLTTCQVHVIFPDKEPLIHQQAQITVYRIFQEITGNIMRHSAATTIDIVLKADDGVLILTVCDNGCGFNPDVVQQHSGMGIESIRQRTAILEGSLIIQSKPGAGTRISVSIPTEKT